MEKLKLILFIFLSYFFIFTHSTNFKNKEKLYTHALSLEAVKYYLKKLKII